MQGRYPFKKLPSYEHLRPEDIAVWERFIEKYPNAYETVNYDLKTGKGREYPETPGELIQADMIHLSRKRIDAVAYFGTWVYIIEIKPVANPSAIGQIETYTELYKIDNPEIENIEKVIIAGEIDPDTQTVANLKDIKVWIV